MCQPVSLQQHAARGPSCARIASVQPDREHAFVDVVGVLDEEGIGELRQRMEGLLVAGARYVLVDLTEAVGAEPATSAALVAADQELVRRDGWLRTVGSESSAVTAPDEASLSDLFAIYQAAVRPDAGRGGSRAQ
jgi:hypothetical protein